MAKIIYSKPITKGLTAKDPLLKETLNNINSEYPNTAKIRSKDGLSAVYVTKNYYDYCEAYVETYCNIRPANKPIKEDILRKCRKMQGRVNARLAKNGSK